MRKARRAGSRRRSKVPRRFAKTSRAHKRFSRKDIRSLRVQREFLGQVTGRL